MKRICYAFAALGLTLSVTCYAEETTNTKSSFTHLDKIVAIVNREAITQSELTKEMEEAKKHMEHANQPIPSPPEFKKLVLDNLIAKNLQMQLIHSKGIKVSNEDLDQAVQSVAKANKISVEQLKTALEQSGVNFDQYKAQIHDQLLLQKLQQEAVVKTVTMKPEDVTEFVRKNKDKFNQYNAYHVIDIALPTPDTSTNQVEALRKQATEISNQLKNGKDIDEVIKEHPLAEKNDLGWGALPEFPSLFQSRIAAMRVNTTSAPLQAPNGFHVLKLVEAKGENLKPSEKDLKNLAFQQKVSEAVKEWVQKLRDDSYVKIMN
ncbi:MAG: SurA N-terminal domain-containing protein [Gammaproteobacteria bacterium]|nr:SurA N-terminal domain-containing protein [Gammaproteobacteria bacterium]